MIFRQALALLCLACVASGLYVLHEQEDQDKAPSNDSTSADAPVVYAIACHHKAGIHLTDKIQQAWEKRLGSTEVFTQFNRHDQPTHTGSRRYNCLDQAAYENLRHGPSYKLVHVVRDPLDLVISAYWYHYWSKDTQLVPNTGPGALMGRSMQEGLRIEAEGELQSTLPEMAGAAQASSLDDRVLTIGIEDFTDNFNSTLMRIYRHFFGRGDPMEAEMIARAAVHDKSTHEAENRQDVGHINSQGHYALARKTIKADDIGPWDAVKAYRGRLGYVQIEDGIWRHRNKSSPVKGK